MAIRSNAFGFEEMPNSELSLEHLPPPNAEFWGAISGFALSFDGYGHWGSFDKCAEIANKAAENYRKRGKLPQSLTDLRTCLFFEQRRWHHTGETPEGEDLRYIHAIVEAIREKIAAGKR